MSSITWDAPAAFGMSRGGRPVDVAAARPARLRLTPRGRTLVAAVAGVLALAGAFSAQRAEAGTAAPAQPVITHVVAPGETLWELAAGIAAPGEDVRDVVQSLIELNNLPGGALAAGQQILLPTS